MRLDLDTLFVVAVLNTTILMVVFAGVLWAYRSLSATRYWLLSLILPGVGTVLLAFGTTGQSDATASLGSWLFGMAYWVAWQGVRVFYGKPPAWRVTAVGVGLSALILLGLLNQPHSVQSVAIALVQLVSILPVVLTIARHPLRPGGLVVLGGAALATVGNVAEAATSLVAVLGAAGDDHDPVLAAWFYLAVIVGAGVCYVGFALMAFERVRTRQRDFVAVVTHEFRAPLAVIAAAADNLALAPAADPQEVELRAARIQRTVRRMSVLIDNIFADDRVDTWQAPFAAEAAVELNDVLHGVAADLENDAAARVSFVPGDAAVVKGDRKLLEIAVLNLIQNALKYSAADSPVTVRLSAAPTEARITVTDHGIGIPADEREQIFLKHYRVAGQQPNGSGLGLYIARAIARQHGGDLTLTASGPGGSTFCLSLPLA